MWACELPDDDYDDDYQEYCDRDLGLWAHEHDWMMVVFRQVLLADFSTGYTRISSCAGQGA